MKKTRKLGSLSGFNDKFKTKTQLLAVVFLVTTVSFANTENFIGRTGELSKNTFNLLQQQDTIKEAEKEGFVNAPYQDKDTISKSDQLSEVVVTAFGQKKQARSLGYATSTIKSEELVKTGSQNFANALYGKSPGVRITSAPGGSTSAVNIQIRGINSITGSSQPLIVLDGMPIRNGEVNQDFWSDTRLRGNGLLDMNPEDIENISILKGASAAALYGSEAVNGVVLITSKTGKGRKGFGVDFSTNYSIDQIAYQPRYQNVRGPGDSDVYINNNTDSNGFIWYDTTTKKQVTPGTPGAVRGTTGVSRNFGPKFDGQPTMAWDGVMRPYVAQEDGFANLFQTGMNFNTNLAISHNTEKSSIRLSLTHNESESLQPGNNNQKNVANLNASFKTGSISSTDIMVNYVNQHIKNRPYMMHHLLNSMGGMMSRFDNGAWYEAKYKTSLGYLAVKDDGQSLTPDENIRYKGFSDYIANYMWESRENTVNEYSNRVIMGLTETLQIFKDLKIRGRISTDITTNAEQQESPVKIPLVFSPGPDGGNRGDFSMNSKDDKILYGDIMLMYNRQLTENFDINAVAGYTASQATAFYTGRGVGGGLSVEDWYDMNASTNNPTSSSSYRSTLIKDAFFGTVGTNYKNYFFIEGTVRRDRTSTMNPNNNAYVYPSINTSFVLSDCVKLPDWFDYSKLRASWGIVGNYPDIYKANVAYEQKSLGNLGGKSPVLITKSSSSYGNESLSPEMKNEIEFGFETKFIKRRLGLDVSFYHAVVNDQILNLSLAPTTGATSILANVGKLQNQGIEIALTGSPIRTNSFSWEITWNISKNYNKVLELANGATELLHNDYDGQAARLVSRVGQPMGDIMAHPYKLDANGNRLVDTDGLYILDGDKWEKYGNAMPQFTSGFINNFTYKNFSLDVVFDSSWGGYLMPTGLEWLKSRGLTEETLNYMDNSRGGLSYYMSNGKGVQIPNGSSQGPNGEKVYHDGMLLSGATADGNSNTNVISQETYYNNVYNWGGPQYGKANYALFIQRNDYIKLRELSVAFNFPSAWAKKVGASKLSLSAFGRNLFYVYRTIKDMDSEAATAGSRWTNNINNVGLAPATRTYGAMLRASF